MRSSTAILLLVVALAGAVSSARELESLPFIEMPLYVGEQRTALGIFEGEIAGDTLFSVAPPFQPRAHVTLQLVKSPAACPEKRALIVDTTRRPVACLARDRTRACPRNTV